EELRKGTRSVKEIVQFDQEELAEETIEKKARHTLRVLDKIEKLYAAALKQAERLERTPKAKKRSYLRARYELSRTRIEMSQLVRSIEFNATEKKRLIDRLRHTVERLQVLERDADRLERRIESARGDAGEARKELRLRRTEIKEI